jgi:hypothetical protein
MCRKVIKNEEFVFSGTDPYLEGYGGGVEEGYLLVCYNARSTLIDDLIALLRCDNVRDHGMGASATGFFPLMPPI